VVSFEPDPENFPALQAHVALNRVGDRVELNHAAVGTQDGAVPFEAGKASESHISHVPANGAQMVRCICLDTMFADRHVDILKIDVEGYEEWVLQGGINLLSDSRRSPRLMYIEVHPYAWAGLGTSSDSLLSLLAKYSYRVLQLDGQTVKRIDSWGEVVAYKNDD
jgi:FkbM family methyltransferase